MLPFLAPPTLFFRIQSHPSTTITSSLDSPSGYHNNPIQHHPQQVQQQQGGLHFDSNLKDIPQELAGQQQQQATADVNLLLLSLFTIILLVH